MPTKPTEISDEIKTKCIIAVHKILGYSVSNTKGFVQAVHMAYTYVNETGITDQEDIDNLIRMKFLL